MTVLGTVPASDDDVRNYADTEAGRRCSIVPMRWEHRVDIEMVNGRVTRVERVVLVLGRPKS